MIYFITSFFWCQYEFNPLTIWWFSDVFRGYEMGTLARNGLEITQTAFIPETCYWFTSLKVISEDDIFIYFRLRRFAEFNKNHESLYKTLLFIKKYFHSKGVSLQFKLAKVYPVCFCLQNQYNNNVRFNAIIQADRGWQFLL